VIRNAISFAKTAKIFSIPTVLTAMGSKSLGGSILSQIQEVFPDQKPIDRSTRNVFEDNRIVDVLERFGRKNLIIAGLWTDFCVSLSTLHALKAGYGVCIAGDACGDVTPRAHNTAMNHMVHEGAVSMTWPQIHLELLRNSLPRFANKTVPQIAKELPRSIGSDIWYVSVSFQRKLLKKQPPPLDFPLRGRERWGGGYRL
jgi:hypothetical protein